MRPEHTGPAAPIRSETPVQLLIESQDRPAPQKARRFLRTAQHLAAAGTPTVVFLIDDGVSAAVGAQPDVARVVAAGGCVWADEDSLAQRAVPASELSPGVVAAGLDKIAPLLFDPAVRVVWH